MKEKRESLLRVGWMGYIPNDFENKTKKRTHKQRKRQRETERNISGATGSQPEGWRTGLRGSRAGEDSCSYMDLFHLVGSD